jgi:hypothetical protein
MMIRLKVEVCAAAWSAIRDHASIMIALVMISFYIRK